MNTPLEDTPLHEEARLFSLYLIDQEPGPELIDRFVKANRKLFDQPLARERSLVDYCVRHPRALPFLDGACGLIRSESLLRKKILLMAAILETTTSHAGEFLPRTSSTLRLVFDLAAQGSKAAIKCISGCILLLFLELTTLRSTK